LLRMHRTPPVMRIFDVEAHPDAEVGAALPCLLSPASCLSPVGLLPS